jgi:WS/DGAT/MGAT family acyltransferase
VKALAGAAGATVNDVLLDALAGALRRLLGGAARDLRAAVPVDLRDPRAPVGLGNRFGVVFLDLPVGIADPAVRMRTLKRRMDARKRSADALVTFGALAVLGALPVPVQRAVVRLLGSKAGLVMTNVPGPRRTIFLAGSRVRELEYWVPQSGGVGLGVGVLSYAGTVTVSVASDIAVLPEPERLVAAFSDELRDRLDALAADRVRCTL